MLKLAAVGMVALASAGMAYAAHPFITEDTGTQGRGRWQLEANVETTRDDAAGARARSVQPAAVLSYGALEDADLQVGLPYARQEAGGAVNKGVLDLAVDLKWRFYESGAFSLGLKPGITLPTGADERGLGAGRATWGSLLILSYEPGALTFHSHLGYRRNRNTLEQRESLRHVSGVLMLKATQQLRLAVDLSRDSSPDATSRTSIRQAVYGVICSITPDFDLDAGIRRVLSDSASDRALLLGMTVRW